MTTKDLRDKVFDLDEQLQDEKRKSESQATQLVVYATQMEHLRSELRTRDRALNDLKSVSPTACSKKTKEQDEVIARLKEEIAVYREKDSILREKTETARSGLRGLFALIETKDFVPHSPKLGPPPKDEKAPAQASTSATASTPAVAKLQPPADTESNAIVNTKPIPESATTRAHPGTQRKHAQDAAEDVQEPQAKRTRTSNQTTRVDDALAQNITATTAGFKTHSKAKLSRMTRTMASKSAPVPRRKRATGCEVVNLEDAGDGDYVDPHPEGEAPHDDPWEVGMGSPNRRRR
ncbi:MAG: hypothetical protein Q9173_003247 [Seirophora scorigena]